MHRVVPERPLMRQPHPWHSESRSGGGWFVKLSGEQHFLGKHPAGAAKPIKRSGRWNPPSEILAEYHKLMAVRDTASKSDYTLDNIIALYVEELEQENQALAKRYRQILENSRSSSTKESESASCWSTPNSKQFTWKCGPKNTNLTRPNAPTSRSARPS